MSITKVLIANRGEIAVRVARAAREAGIRSVSVYTDADSDAMHVRLADEAYGIPAESYLDIAAFLEVAKRSGSDAVHPGYGFLSERADFAQAVIDMGLTWIGPDPETISLLGDKARARALAAKVGAPLVPGTNGPVKGVSDVISFAEKYGLPIIIKAVSGGGGRGMRVIREYADIRESYDSAIREANAAFGRGECIVERFLDRPRHVEAQVLGDRHGRVAVIGTRDCSLQRRNQKLVEEAPAPFLTSEIRERIHQSAIDVCAAAGYVGAGTVEFLLGKDGTLSFLEVNTRLQVEHPVTEQVSGVDLVHEQFHIAAGKPMTVPEIIPHFGHSIEFRINAEDPGLGFLPTPGTIDRFESPGGPGVRLDSGVYAGYCVPGTFDSLLAKLVIWGIDRDQALARARRALREFHIEGVATVLPFHRHIVTNPAFTASDHEFSVHTRWIEEECTARFEPAPAVPLPQVGRLTRLPMEIDGRMVTIGIPDLLLERPSIARAPSESAGVQEQQGTDATDSGALIAPFQGTLTAWKFSDGSEVACGETVAILEAMKMEVPVKAPVAGQLKQAAACGDVIGVNGIIGAIKAL